jgi:hypothetical protein
MSLRGLVKAFTTLVVRWPIAARSAPQLCKNAAEFGDSLGRLCAVSPESAPRQALKLSLLR